MNVLTVCHKCWASKPSDGWAWCWQCRERANHTPPFAPFPVQPAYKPETQIEEQAPESALDVQEGGSHYKDMGIQPIEFISANNIPYHEANVIKYVCRHANKNGIEDLKKARHYIDMLIEKDYPDGK